MVEAPGAGVRQRQREGGVSLVAVELPEPQGWDGHRGSSLGPPEGVRFCPKLDLGHLASRTVGGETATVSCPLVCGGLQQHLRETHTGDENEDLRGPWPPRDPPPTFPQAEGPGPWKRTGLRAWQTLSRCSDPSEHPHVHARWTHRPWVTRLLSQRRPCSAADGVQTRAQVAHLFRASGGGARACCAYLLFKV